MSHSDVALTSVSEKVIRTVFHVLGFVLSTTPKKDHPFAETFGGLSSCSMTPQPVWQSATRPPGVKSCLPSCMRFCTPIASQPDNCSPSDPGCISPRPACTAALGFV